MLARHPPLAAHALTTLAHTLACLCAAAALAACSTPPAPPSPSVPGAGPGVPAYLLANEGCAIVAGGAIGSRFADAKVSATWTRINAAVTIELHDRLVAQRYRVVKLLVPEEITGTAEQMVFESVAAQRCNRVLQVAHKVDEDAAGRFFRFDITLFRAVPKQGAAAEAAPGMVSVVARGEFQRSYRYPRTQEAFENFYTGDFAEKVLADLRASGGLGVLR